MSDMFKITHALNSAFNVIKRKNSFKGLRHFVATLALPNSPTKDWAPASGTGPPN
jgi:hypothetical protein